MHPFSLSPIDHLFVGSGSQPITFAFYYPEVLDADVLRTGLDSVIKAFPIVQSQLQKTAEDGLYFHVCSQGLLFQVLDSENDFSSTHPIERYISPVQTVEGEPLTKISVTRTPKGTVLAVSLSHALVDGFSYFHFLSSWAKACKGERFLPPSLDRAFFLSIGHDDFKIVTEKDILDRCGLFLMEQHRGAALGVIKKERFFLSDEEIKSLQEKARSQVSSSFTAHDVVTAFIWEKYSAWTGKLADDESLYLTCPVDFRRLAPEVSRFYFGCALCFATAAIPAGLFATARLGDLALAIKTAIGNVKSEYIKTSMEKLTALRQQKGVAVMERVHLRHPSRGLIVTNLTRMPIHDLDFGQGQPADFVVYVEVSSSAAILSADKGVEVFLVHPGQ